MPALPSPPLFSSAFNAAQIIRLTVFIVVVVVVCELYLVALHIDDKVAEQRARVMDIEAASKPSSIAVHEQSLVMSTKQKAATAVLVATHAKLPVKAKGIAPVPVVSLTGSKLVLKMTISAQLLYSCTRTSVRLRLPASDLRPPNVRMSETEDHRVFTQ
ncbi:hypothetical protein B0H17DRAFT_1223248 [Mycena rosella]|uniref:Uncharacterized protein n=1 Tax=Mycena rosella TaxID=1033263 RepID=A0AAD7AWD3_MYCRO|nr:hypothetical protein B0H17DRAFT_1223248 [Mycena rosella]